MMRYSFSSRRTSSTHALPTTKPITMPPIASTKNVPTAPVALNAPVTPAAIAKRNSTRPVASFSRLSPSSRMRSRRGSFTRSSTARAETASGGETIAPSAKQAGHERDGTSMCETTATTTHVNTTAPTASDVTPTRCRRNGPIAMLHAPSISSGGRKITSTSPGSMLIVGSPGTNASAAPPTSSPTDGGSPTFCAR